jgi:hypothetical protein
MRALVLLRNFSLYLSKSFEIQDGSQNQDKHIFYNKRIVFTKIIAATCLCKNVNENSFLSVKTRERFMQKASTFGMLLFLKQV